MIGLIAKLKIKEGKVDEVIEMFRGLIANVRKEEGTLFYTVNRDSADPNTLVVMERYRDKDARRAHSKTPYLIEFFQKVGPLLEGNPEIAVLDEILSI
jgi:quinol monooxygenase YgiN